MKFQSLLNFILSLFIKKHNKPRIALSNYPAPNLDIGTLSIIQEIAMRNILAACEAGEDRTDILELTQKEFDVVVDHIGLYFGSEDICKNISLKRDGWATVNLEAYAKAKAHKAELDSRIDMVLSTMYEGTTEEKLEQVCKYIAKHAKYKYGTNNPLDLLNEGGMCGAYSMLFYKMATRLGIQAYICYGHASNGIRSGAHAWNMVNIDGNHFFYDVTFYDGSYESKYLHSNTVWSRTYALNDKSAMATK